MASHLSNPVVITRELKLTFTPTGAASGIVIDHGSFNLPGTEPGTEYTYTTDEETLRGSSQAAGYTSINVETPVDANWSTWTDYSLEAKGGILDIEAKNGATTVFTKQSYNVQVNACSEAEFGINDPNIPVYQITFAVNSKVTQ